MKSLFDASICASQRSRFICRAASCARRRGESVRDLLISASFCAACARGVTARAGGELVGAAVRDR